MMQSELFKKMAQRLLNGMQVHTETLATAIFEGINFQIDFFKQKITRKLCRKEQYLPSPVIDLGSIRAWLESGRTDTFVRAQSRAAKLLDTHQMPDTAAAERAELTSLMQRTAREAGMDVLPAFN